MNEPDRSLELSGEGLRQLVERALQYIGPHIDSLSDQPAWEKQGGEALARSLIEQLPEEGRPIEELLALIFDRLAPLSLNTASPGYLAYIPGGGILHAAVADLIADAVNRYVAVWLAAPGFAQLEANVVRWFCDIVGYPVEAGGYLTTGGSLANWSAIVTARRCRLPENFLDGVIYTSDQVHHSVQKAAVLAGFPRTQVRVLESDDRFHLDVIALRRAIAEDRRRGQRPFLVVASAGTTNTGAVDDLQALAQVAEEHDLWLHVDAAYGGFFMLTERGSKVMAGIERADSITLDPHKGLFLPYGNGSLLVRRAEDLRRTHALDADYMPVMQDADDLVDFCQISPELSRDFRGLRVWLPLKMHGVGPFRRNLDEKLDLAAYAANELAQIEGIEIVVPPELSIVAFRLVRAGYDDAAHNRLNQQLLRRINAPKRVFLTETTIDGRFVIRICVLSFRTHRDRIDECLDTIRQVVADGVD